MNAIFYFFFRLFGWKLDGEIPADVRKAVIAVAPHNTWKDFTIGLGARAGMKRKIGYLGKEELFKGPFGFIFKWLGGTPVVRTSNNNMVKDYATAIKNADDILFALAPEGTRKSVENLRTGFYYMAYEGGIPIIPISFNFGNKTVKVGQPFKPTGNFEEDMKKYFLPFFSGVKDLKKWYYNYSEGIF